MKKALLDSFIWRGVYFTTTLLVNIGIARVYEASESGWIYFISNNFNLVLLVGSVSLDSSMTYFAASGQIKPQKLALFAVLWPLLVALLSTCCTFFLMQQNIITSNYFFLLVAGAAYTFGITLTNFYTALFYAHQNFVTPNIFMSIINVLLLLLIPLFAKGIFSLDRNQFLYVYFLLFVVQGGGLVILFYRSYITTHLFQFPLRSEMKVLFQFAFIALAANIAYYLIHRIDYLFVEAWCSAKAMGNYVQVSKMGQLLLIVPSIAASAVYPQAAKGDSVAVIKLILKIIGPFILLYIVLFAIAYLASDWFFTWLFGSTFNEMYIPFLVLLPGILFLSIHIIIAAYFGGKNKPVYNLITTTAGLLVVIVGDVLLIKPMGITGAALVSSLGYTATFICSITLFMRYTNSTWRQVFTSDMFRLKTYMALFSNQNT